MIIKIELGIENNNLKRAKNWIELTPLMRITIAKIFKINRLLLSIENLNELI